ncbi:MAG: CCA tRNA nucleotidyltransferase [Pseudomonadota bacterium]
MSRPGRVEGPRYRNFGEALHAPDTQALLLALERDGFEARLVGGCVRDGLLGHVIKDVDIATTAAPDVVMTIARGEGFRAHPTGIDHGTVTVVSGAIHHPLEVTTLRRDVETHGRRAVVAFTTDWVEDAMRRDFTINALYCDRNGVFFDPLGTGRKDLDNRQVRFIGDARARIQEDYLRILRFFRFFGRFADGPPNAEALMAIEAETDGLKLLSAERVRDELLKILTAGMRLEEALSSMQQTGVLDLLFGPADWKKRVQHILRYRQIVSHDLPEYDLNGGEVSLGFLAGVTQETILDFSDKMRLSNHARRFLSNVFLLVESGIFRPDTDETAFRKATHRLGLMGQGELLTAGRWAWALSDDLIDCQWRLDQIRSLETMHFPEMPLGGKDVIALGVAPGPDVGEILREFRQWWIEQNCPSDEVLLRQKLSEFARPFTPNR